MVDNPGRTSECCLNESGNSSAGLDEQNNARILEAAADYLRRGCTADAECAQNEIGETTLQIRLLGQWAFEAGRLTSLDSFLALSLVSDCTSEHKVYFDSDRNRAVKQTLPGQFGWVPSRDHGRWTLGIAKPLDYLLRWILFNIVFGDAVELEGVAGIDSSMVIGEKAESLSIIVSQHWHRASDINHPAPSTAEISMFLRKLGFEPIPNSFHGWQRAADNVVLLDARPDNFIKTSGGVAPIDLPITRVD